MTGSRRILTGLAVLLLVPVAGALAQGTQGSAAKPDTGPEKVGVLNVRQAIISTSEGKQASAELQSQFAPRQNEMDNLRRQIDDVQNRLRSGERTLSDEEKARLQRHYELLTRQYQRKQEEVQEELNMAQSDVVDRIGRKMIDVLDRYARENGYTVVLDTSAQSTPVIYAASQVDITQDIIRLYDQAHPVKSAAPARPAPGQPAQKPPAQKPPAQKPPQE